MEAQAKGEGPGTSGEGLVVAFVASALALGGLNAKDCAWGLTRNSGFGSSRVCGSNGGGREIIVCVASRDLEVTEGCIICVCVRRP